MTPKPRLPSFNDFSPGTLKGDIRTVLKAVADYPGDDKSIFAAWYAGPLAGWDKKRAETNIPATLASTGLASGKPMTLTPFGERVLAAATASDAAQVFCAEVIREKNGLKLLEAIENLRQRGDQATKKTLQVELERLGIGDLANDTTDHTTLKNWMVAAGIVKEAQKGRPVVDDAVLKRLVGFSIKEYDELESLPVAQRVFLTLLRRRHLTEAGPFDVSGLYTECQATHPHAFKGASLAALVKDPLEAGGWIELSGVAKASSTMGKAPGGKSGWVTGTTKLLDIPIERVVPNFDSAVPPDLRSKLQTPLEQIKQWLGGADTHKGGLALELLVLRIILDLRLSPRDFRLRSKDSAFAEVDVTAEGSHLLFSRWTFQCKRIQESNNVGLSDVAKEVGIAVYMRAHVIAMVSTGGFTSEALNYAREVAKATHLQFVFIDKAVIHAYLTKGPVPLHDFVMSNAARVFTEKQTQPISPGAMR